jgi:hypothetical protein
MCGMSTASLRASAIAIAGGLCALTLSAAPAGAATVGLAGGSTTLKLDPKAAAALRSLGVSVTPTGRAKASSAGVAFPISGGRIDPATAAGTIRHTGGLRLRAGGTRVTLSDFTIAVRKTPTMSAKVNGGARLGALVPVLGDAKVTRSAVRTTVTGVAIHLSTKGARALNAAFGVTAFKPRFKLGTATVRAQPATVALAGERTELALDAGTAATLASLGVTPGVVAPASATAGGALAFPITGGALAPATLRGEVTHSGGISLTAGATVVTLTDFTIDTAARQLTGTVNGGARVALLDLDLSSPAVTTKGLGLQVGNVPATLTAGAAQALNAAFGVTAFTAGLRLGVATVVGQAA